MRNKKAQAALEFLTTYGWAFLVIIVMIGALAYFGVLSPERFISERCNLGVEWQCDKDLAFANASGSEITMEVTYMGSQSGMNLTNATFNSSDVNCPADVASAAIANTFNSRQSQTLVFTGCTGLAVGDKVNGELTLFYNTDPAYPKTQLGELVISVS